MSETPAAPRTGRRRGSETGLPGKAARSTREVARGEEHRVSVVLMGTSVSLGGDTPTVLF